MAAKKTLAATAVLILFVAMLTPNTVLGAYSIGFQSGGTWVNDITGKAVGDTVNVSVYFRATDDELAVGGTKGLIGMGTLANFDSALGDVTSSVVNATEFPGFPNTTINNAAGTLSYVGAVNLADRNPPAGNKGAAIWLGDFTYRIDNPGANVFKFGDLDKQQNEFTVFDEGTSDFVELDAILFGTNFDVTYNLTISTVPEPSSMMLGLSALAIGALVWRRRKSS